MYIRRVHTQRFEQSHGAPSPSRMMSASGFPSEVTTRVVTIAQSVLSVGLEADRPLADQMTR
jgi:hypothetical protein